MSNRKSNMHKVLEKNFLNHLIKAKERVVLEFMLGNWNQAPKYNQTLFHTFVVVVICMGGFFGGFSGLFFSLVGYLWFLEKKSEYHLSTYKR